MSATPWWHSAAIYQIYPRSFRDLNGDGWPDLYVCNDFAYWPDRVWLNRPHEGFAAAPRMMFRNQSLSSMAVEVADFDRDGLGDLWEVAQGYSTNNVNEASSDADADGATALAIGEQ